MPPSATIPAHAKPTPWRHASELAMVRSWFFPRHTPIDPYSPAPPDMRQTAIDHVQMWAFKDPKLPHTIMATAHLTEALLHDTPDGRRSISAWALRSIYAMAFCRFVNGFVDRDIARAAKAVLRSGEGGGGARAGDETAAPAAPGKGEGSMYAHAAAIGMPERFVDLRHRATHEEMPSLETLRDATEAGLQWLWERWWRANATGDPRRALWEREERKQLAVTKRVLTVNSSAVSAETLADSERAGDGDELCTVCRKRKKKGGRGRGNAEMEEDEEDEEPRELGGDDLRNGKGLKPPTGRNPKKRHTAFGLFEPP